MSAVNKRTHLKNFTNSDADCNYNHSHDYDYVYVDTHHNYSLDYAYDGIHHNLYVYVYKTLNHPKIYYNLDFS